MSSQDVKHFLCLLLSGLLISQVPTAQSSDPCQGSSSVCGDGAVCKSNSNLAVCVCPEGTVGDPFVSCRPSTSSTTTSNYRNNGMPTTTIYSTSSSSSSSPSSPPHSQYTTVNSMSTSDMPTSSSSSTSSTSGHYTTTPQQSSRPTTYHSQNDRYNMNSDAHFSSRDSTPSTTIYTSSSSSYPSTQSSHLGPIADYSGQNDNRRSDYSNNNNDRHQNNDNNNYHSNSNNNHNNDYEMSSSPNRYNNQHHQTQHQNQNQNYHNSHSTNNYNDNNRHTDYHHNQPHSRPQHQQHEHVAPIASNSNVMYRDGNLGHDNTVRRHDDIGHSGSSSNGNSNNYRNRIYEDSSPSSSNGPINGHHNMNTNSNSNPNTNSGFSHRVLGSHGNDIPSSPILRDSSSNSESVRDPLGVYSNCKTVNSIIVCADESDSSSKTNYNPSSRNSMSSSSQHQGNGNNYYSGNMNSNMHRNQDSKPISYHPTSTHNVNYKSYEGSHNDNDYSNNNRRTVSQHQNEHMSGRPLQEFVVRSNGNNPDSLSYSKNHVQMEDDRRLGGVQNNNRNNDLLPQPGNPETCSKYCGVQSICRMLLGRPICGCPEGFTGDPSVRCTPAEDQIKMANRCLKPTDCSENMVCEHEQCIDPCKTTDSITNNNYNNNYSNSRGNMQMETSTSGLRNTFNHYHPNNRNNYSRGGKFASTMRSLASSRGSLCGPNTKCKVIQYTALCGCLDGYTGNPYTGCEKSV